MLDRLMLKGWKDSITVENVGCFLFQFDGTKCSNRIEGYHRLTKVKKTRREWTTYNLVS